MMEEERAFIVFGKICALVVIIRESNNIKIMAVEGL